MKVVFRKATREDVKDIIALCNECFLECTDNIQAEKIFKETINDPNQIYLLGFLEGELVAHSKITIIPTMFQNMETYSILNHVCVKPKYRRYHIATKMLDECNRISKEHNCISMKLWSNNVRKAAHACYKRYGFVVNEATFFSKEVI